MNLQRDSYLLSRDLGDVKAFQKGRLINRLVKRQYHRSLINLLRKGGLW